MGNKGQRTREAALTKIDIELSLCEEGGVSESYDFFGRVDKALAPVRAAYCPGRRRTMVDERGVFAKVGFTLGVTDAVLGHYSNIKAILTSGRVPNSFKEALKDRIQEYIRSHSEFRTQYVLGQIDELDGSVRRQEIKTYGAYVQALERIVTPLSGTLLGSSVNHSNLQMELAPDTLNPLIHNGDRPVLHVERSLAQSYEPLTDIVGRDEVIKGTAQALLARGVKPPEFAEEMAKSPVVSAFMFGTSPLVAFVRDSIAYAQQKIRPTKVSEEVSDLLGAGK